MASILIDDTTGDLTGAYRDGHDDPRVLAVDVTPNRLLYGDNLRIMEKIPAQYVDLIYLDPPFNSQQTYNMMYRTLTGRPVPEQAEAFSDTWTMTQDQWAMLESMPVLVHKYGIETQYGELWKMWLTALKDSQPALLSYLLYMLRRLLQMRVLLKPTGSLFIHCDPTASHYLKVLLDGIFGHENFRNEIIWRRTGSHNSARRFGPVHDVILFYSKGDKYTWNDLKRPYMRGHVEKAFRERHGRYYTNYSGNVLSGSGRSNGESGKPWRGFDPDAKGRHWAIPKKITTDLQPDFFALSPHQKLDYLYGLGRITIKAGDEWPRYQHEIDPEKDGQPISDLWAYQPYTEGTVFGTNAGIDEDVRWMGTKDGDRLGYETQKPISLLKRIISAASNPGDLVFDPFCGCGTTVYAAHELGRKWLGCDIAILAIELVADTVYKRYGLQQPDGFKITGIPVSVQQAEALFKEDATEFQNWAVQRVGGFAIGRKSNDKGIDGRIYYEAKPSMRSMILQVKGGKNIGPSDIRDLRGALEREQGVDMAGYISLREPSVEMRREAVAAGVFTHNDVSYPRIQLLTVREILEEKRDFKSPSKIGSRVSGQVGLPL